MSERQCTRCEIIFEPPHKRWSSWLCPSCLKKAQSPTVRSAKKQRQMERDDVIPNFRGSNEAWWRSLSARGKAGRR